MACPERSKDSFADWLSASTFLGINCRFSDLYRKCLYQPSHLTGPKKMFSLFFCNSGDWAQGPVHMRHALCHWVMFSACVYSSESIYELLNKAGTLFDCYLITQTLSKGGRMFSYAMKPGFTPNWGWKELISGLQSKSRFHTTVIDMLLRDEKCNEISYV